MHLISSQQSPFPSSPLVKERFGTDLSRFVLNPSSSKAFELPTTASLPSPPMSGSPPPPSPPYISRTDSLRRKRSASPVATASQAGYGLTRLAYEPNTRLQGFQPRYAGEIPSQVPTFPSPFQQGFGGSYMGTAGNVGLHQSTYLPVGHTLLSQHDVPGPARATRKPKAHVASACVNCKKKHLRCENTRPCKRCVQSGKEVG